MIMLMVVSIIVTTDCERIRHADGMMLGGFQGRSRLISGKDKVCVFLIWFSYSYIVSKLSSKLMFLI